jgi:PKD repeat protein
MQGEWSGEVSWSQVQYNVTAGQHTFKWEYSKDYSVTNGSDCGWVDYIILPSGANQNLTALFSGNPTELCEGQTVNFTDYSIGEIVFWNWSFPGGDPLTSTLQNPSVLYLNAGIYDVSLTVSDGTGTQTLTLEDYIHVYTFPAIPEKPQGEEYPMSFPGLAYEYKTGSVANAGDYDWIAEPAEAIESMVITDTSCLIDFVDYIYLTCTLKVKALNECGESEYSEELILYVWWEGIEESSLGNLKISPNPNNGRFIISFGQPISDPVDIMILNTIGEVVYTKDHILPGENQLLDIDPGYFMPGVYLVEVRNDKTCRTSKIIVK